jgi:hypothetical protein
MELAETSRSLLALAVLLLQERSPSWRASLRTVLLLLVPCFSVAAMLPQVMLTVVSLKSLLVLPSVATEVIFVSLVVPVVLAPVVLL